MQIHTIVFDLGGVLIDWNPRYLFRKVFQNDSARMEYFLSEICTASWNVQQDAGRTFDEGCAVLKKEYPDYADAIDAYHFRWEEMLGDANLEVVSMLKFFKESKFPVYALTNWSKEKFPIARNRFDFLQKFDGILVSGEVGLKKPDPKFFQLLFQTYSFEALGSVFIDDSLENIEAAQQLGMHGIHFKNASQLRKEFSELGIRGL
ncbi:MAG: HAD family phosphatase [SAR324 cluster bacterium]|nr:HAD family phosphatase [SAR324 cluster bacterium]